MKRVIWVGETFFKDHLARRGLDVRYVTTSTGECLGWSELLERSGFLPEEPDLVLLADSSNPPLIHGMEKFPCLTAFYAVDTHIHSWMPYYAQGFDLCLVSLKEHLDLFRGKCLNKEQIHWFPPYIIPEPQPCETASLKDKEWDLLFVGNTAGTPNRPRLEFMQNLKNIFPAFHFMTGDYTKLYPKARIVLNHCIGGELNFRVFEALGCGACLLTPKNESGLLDLFTDGEDMVTYEQGNVEQIAELAGGLLKSPERRSALAQAGHAKVIAGHTAASRAASLHKLLLDWEDSGKAGKAINSRLQGKKPAPEVFLRPVFLLHAEAFADPSLKAAYLNAALKLSKTI